MVVVAFVDIPVLIAAVSAGGAAGFAGVYGSVRVRADASTGFVGRLRGRCLVRVRVRGCATRCWTSVLSLRGHGYCTSGS